MKLKVGDKVRIRKDLEVDEQYGTLTLYEGYMSSLRGNICTIKKLIRDRNFVFFEVEENPFCWSKEMLELVENNKLIFRDNATILLQDGKRYVTKCQAGDTYDREKGLLLCLAKANGYTYNDICEMLNNAEYQGEKPDAVKFDKVREVKRPAKVGEYVKIVKADISCGCYNNGEIYKVIEANRSCGDPGVYINTRKTHPCCIMYRNRYGQSFVSDREYVVLENYKTKVDLSK